MSINKLSAQCLCGKTGISVSKLNYEVVSVIAACVGSGQAGLLWAWVKARMPD